MSVADPISFFVPSYPNPSDPDFSYKLSTKSELAELRLGPSEQTPEQGELLKSQLFMQRFFSPHTSYPHSIVYHGLGTGKCIDGSSMVDTDRGTLSIAEVWQGYSSSATIFDGEGFWATPTTTLKVISYDASAHMMLRSPIQRMYRQPIAEKVRHITLSNGSTITATKRHRLLVSPIGESDDLWTNGYQVGDFVAVSNAPLLNLPGTIRDFSTIISIEEIYFEGYVYDLDVKDYHNYLANGVLCHNTCLASAVEEANKSTPVGNKPRRPALIFAKSDDLKRNIIQEIANVCTAKGTYEAKPTEDEVRRGIDMSEEAKTIRLNKAIAKSYEIVTYETFLKTVAKYDVEAIRKAYSNRVIIVDEAHSVRIQGRSGKSKEGKKGKGKEKETDVQPVEDDPLGDASIAMYDELYRFLHAVEGCRILLLTGTPIWDRPSEIASLVNLILPETEALPTGNEFERRYFDEAGNLRHEDELRKAFHGKVSTLRQMITTAKRTEMGTKAPWLKKITIHPNAMSDLQATAAKRAYEEKEEVATKPAGTSKKEARAVAGGTIYKLALDAANMVYPTSYDDKGRGKTVGYGPEVFKKYAMKNPKTTGKSGKGRIEYGFTDPKLRKELTDNLSTYTAKFAAIISEIKAHPDEVAFIYCENVTGTGGAISLALTMQLHGFEWAKTADTIRSTSTKKRFAVITSYPQTTSEPSQIAKLLASANKPDNKYGDRLQVIIGSEKIALGISIKNVRQYHLAMPHWNVSSTDQAENRGYRFGGHDALPEEERYIRIYRHAAVEGGDAARGLGFPASSGFSPKETVDIYVYRIAEEKESKNSQIYRILKEESFDCPLFYERNVLPTDVDGTRPCDYQKCNYTCSGYPDGLIDRRGRVWRYRVRPEDVDHTTYDLFYARDDVRRIISDIQALFHNYFAIPIDRIVGLLDLGSTSDNLVLQAIDTIINSRLPIRDPYGFPAVLKEDGDMLFLDREVSIKTRYAGSIYIKAPLITERTPMDDIVELIELKKDAAKLKELCRSPESAAIEDLSYKSTVVIMEAAYANRKSAKGKLVLETLLEQGDIFEMADGTAVHIMYMEEHRGQAYDVAAKELKPTGQMRVFVPVEGTWTYIGDSDREENYITQIKEILESRAEAGLKDNPYGIFGSISKKDKQFRIKKRGGRGIGKECAFFDVADLLNIYFDNIRFLPKAKPDHLKKSRSELIDLLEGLPYHKHRYSDEDIEEMSTEHLAQLLTLLAMSKPELCEGLKSWFIEHDLLYML